MMRRSVYPTAGLKYFAFDYCPAGSGAVGPNYYATSTPDLFLAFALYQSSSQKSLINWCGCPAFGQLFAGTTFSANNWQSVMAVWAGWMAQSNYQKVLVNRPLLFLRWSASGLAASYCGGYANFQTAIAYLNSLLAAEGLGPVYLVILADSATITTAAGAAAVGNYNSYVAPVACPDTYANLDTSTRAFWSAMAAQGSPIIPIAQTGWDVRPDNIRRAGILGSSQVFLPGTPAQIATHLAAGVSHVNSNPTQCPAGTMLIYSWNECSEGGSALIPTLGDPPVNTDTAYVAWQSVHGGPAALSTSNLLAAIGAVLRGA